MYIIIVRILLFIMLTTCGAFRSYGLTGAKLCLDRFFHFIRFHESSVCIVSIVRIVSIMSTIFTVLSVN